MPQEPCVILAKHQSAWETMTLQDYVPKGAYCVFVLKKELLRVPLIGWGLGAMKMISIDRAGRQGCARPGRQPRDANGWNKGFYVIIFPEGTRVAPGAERRYKPGGAYLATQVGCKVVPVAHDAGELWPRQAFLKKPGTVTISIGPAFDATGLTEAEVNKRAEAWIEGEMRRISPASLPGCQDQRSLRRRAASSSPARRSPTTCGTAGGAPSASPSTIAGLRVGAPLQARLGDIETLIREHGQWVLDKLADWRERPTPEKLAVGDGTVIFSLGAPLTVTVTPGSRQRWLFSEPKLHLFVPPAVEARVVARKGAAREGPPCLRRAPRPLRPAPWRPAAAAAPVLSPHALGQLQPPWRHFAELAPGPSCRWRSSITSSPTNWPTSAK
jgi:1-acyl-sn-glycerol-3-phosphate acyltransferase